MITLRLATMEDEAILLRWRNDPHTRKWSRTTVEITEAQHHTWMLLTVDDPLVRLFIAEHGGARVGTGRLNLGEGEAVEVNLTVAPECRGRGFGTAIVKALVAYAQEHGHRNLRAYVKPGNLQSLISFLIAGFEPVDPEQLVVLKPEEKA